MADVIVRVVNNRAVVQVSGAEALLRLAEAATRDNAERAEAALEQIEDIAAGAPDAPSVVSKLDRAANLSDLANAGEARLNIGLKRATFDEARDESVDDRSMTPKAAFETMRVLVEWINPREKRFAGGARLNGVDDDAPSIRAAIAFARTQGTRFGGGCPKMKLPAGVVRLASAHPSLPDRTLDVTAADNLVLEGEGDGATTLLNLGDRAAIKSSDAQGNPLFRLGLKDFTVQGPGSTYVNADGIDLGPNNNCLVNNVRIFAARRGLAYGDSFQSRFTGVQMNGQGGLAVRDGFFAKEGTLTQPENAVEIIGGQVFGATRYGFRGECVTGTKVFGTEVLGCGNIGVYIGESPNGKDLKWFTWVGGLIDTCPDLLVIKRGSAALAHYMHLSGMWLGYANEGLPGAGVGVELDGLKDCAFSADMLVNTSYAALVSNCERIYLGARTVSQYDRLLQGSPAIVVNNVTRSRFDIGTTNRETGAPSTQAFIEQGSSNRNYVTGYFDGTVTLVGAQSRFDGITG